MRYEGVVRSVEMLMKHMMESVHALLLASRLAAK